MWVGLNCKKKKINNYSANCKQILTANTFIPKTLFNVILVKD